MDQDAIVVGIPPLQRRSAAPRTHTLRTANGETRDLVQSIHCTTTYPVLSRAVTRPSDLYIYSGSAAATGVTDPRGIAYSVIAGLAWGEYKARRCLLRKQWNAGNHHRYFDH